ncbi:MAG: CPBP family intramembrane glutamic endopeptidase [Terriglobales bacterium]
MVFLFLELAIWAPNREGRNHWSAVAALTIFALVLIEVLVGRCSLRRLGLGLPKLANAGVVLGTGLAMASLLMLLAWSMGGEIPANPQWFNLHSAWGYAIWALLQEFILQSFFFTRLEEGLGGSTAVWVAATLFAAAHLPNPVLTTATLIGSLLFCEMFRRYRSLYPLAIVHAVLGLSLALTVPDSILHHMRVGIGYLRY